MRQARWHVRRGRPAVGRDVVIEDAYEQQQEGQHDNIESTYVGGPVVQNQLDVGCRMPTCIRSLQACHQGALASRQRAAQRPVDWRIQCVVLLSVFGLHQYSHGDLCRMMVAELCYRWLLCSVQSLPYH
jgi:hypothetical protein